MPDDNPIFNKAYGFSHAAPAFTFVFASGETGDSGQTGVWRPLRPTDFGTLTFDGQLSVDTDTLEENVQDLYALNETLGYQNGVDGQTWAERIYNGATKNFTLGESVAIETYISTNDSVDFFSQGVVLTGALVATGEVAEVTLQYNCNADGDYNHDAILMFNHVGEITVNGDLPFFSGIRLSVGDLVTLNPEEFAAASIHSEPSQTQANNTCHFYASIYYKK